MNRPWMKFYPADWRSEPRLRMCSLSARGLWIEMMSYMHEGEPYGHLLIDGKPPDVSEISALVGRPIKEVTKALDELRGRGVFSTSEAGTIYSRRMVRDKAKEATDRKNGKGGGNPKLKPPENGLVNQEANGGVIPPDKAHMLEARIQKESRKQDAASAAADAAPNFENGHDPPTPEAELFKRGKAVLGKTSGGLIRNLLKAKGGNVALARAALETASTKFDPREYVVSATRGDPDISAKEALRLSGNAW